MWKEYSKEKPTEEEHQLNVRQYFPGDEDKIPF